jgi:hypothetical protein
LRLKENFFLFLRNINRNLPKKHRSRSKKRLLSIICLSVIKSTFLRRVWSFLSFNKKDNVAQKRLFPCFLGKKPSTPEAWHKKPPLFGIKINNELLFDELDLFKPSIDWRNKSI